MGVTVVVGGQFGGEGKGKVAHFLALESLYLCIAQSL
jgi:adenylosuccinate synthase